jgi:hypothetical protein
VSLCATVGQDAQDRLLLRRLAGKVRRGAAVELSRSHDYCAQAKFCTAPILTRYIQTSENLFERKDNAEANKRF